MTEETFKKATELLSTISGLRYAEERAKKVVDDNLNSLSYCFTISEATKAETVRMIKAEIAPLLEAAEREFRELKC